MTETVTRNFTSSATTARMSKTLEWDDDQDFNKFDQSANNGTPNKEEQDNQDDGTQLFSQKLPANDMSGMTKMIDQYNLSWLKTNTADPSSPNFVPATQASQNDEPELEYENEDNNIQPKNEGLTREALETSYHGNIYQLAYDVSMNTTALNTQHFNRVSHYNYY